MTADFDPVMLRLGGIELYWYGAVYSIGFLGGLLWFLLRADRLGLNRRDVVELTILLAAGCLIGGRVFDILVYERAWYAAHPWQAFDLWQGGLATHGVMLGALAGAIVFGWLRGVRPMVLLDEIVVPGAVLMAVGRVGNFIDGGVIGSPSDLPWAVLIPGVEGARHPVPLYDAAKNLAIAPVLWLALRRWPAGTGVGLGLFLLLYGGLRVLVDLFRDYESALFGLPPGQIFNLAFALAGALVLALGRRRSRPAPRTRAHPPQAAGRWRALLLVALVLYPLGIPTSWTRANIAGMRSAPELPPELTPEEPPR